MVLSSIRTWVAATALALASPSQAATDLLPCPACRLPVAGPAADKSPVSRQAFRVRGPGAVDSIATDEMFRINLPARGLTSSAAARSLVAHKGLLIEASRRTARSANGADRAGARREKVSLAAVALRYAAELGADDHVTFGITGAIEKRRFALDLAGGHVSTSRSVGLEAAWSHGPSWRLAAGYRDDMGSARSSGIVRRVELAEGASRSQRGPWAAIAFTPGGREPNSASFGMKLQSSRLSEADRSALGSAGRGDTRATVNATLHFR